MHDCTYLTTLLFLDHNGHQRLRKTHPEQFTRKSHRPNLGAFGNVKAQSLLNRATETVRYVKVQMSTQAPATRAD